MVAGESITIVGSQSELMRVVRGRVLNALRTQHTMQRDATYAIREQKVEQMCAGWNSGWSRLRRDLDDDAWAVHAQHAADAMARYTRLNETHLIASEVLWRESVMENPAAYFAEALDKARASAHALGLEAIMGPAAPAPAPAPRRLRL
jgi:hypothetical protein